MIRISKEINDSKACDIPGNIGKEKLKKTLDFYKKKNCKICQKMFASLLSATNLRYAAPLNLNPGSAPESYVKNTILKISRYPLI